MGSYLPSKWFIVIVFPLVSIGIVAGLFLLYTRQGDVSTAQEPTVVMETAAAIRTQAIETDSDHDGLKDWEESLWKSDPRKEDTDGDGTKDGDEIMQNRNPAKPGPDDDLPRLSDSETSVGLAGSSSPLTVTGAIGRELVASYLTLKQTGQYDKETQQKLIEALANEAAHRASPKLRSMMDLNISVAANEVTRRNYRDELVRILTPLRTTGQSEMLILGQRLTNLQDPSIAKQFEDILTLYQTTIRSLQLMSVPRDAAAFHLAFLNSVISYEHSLQGMASITQDPIRAYAASGSYFETEQKMGEAAQALQQYFTSNGLERL